MMNPISLMQSRGFEFQGPIGYSFRPNSFEGGMGSFTHKLREIDLFNVLMYLAKHWPHLEVVAKDSPGEEDLFIFETKDGVLL